MNSINSKNFNFFFILLPSTLIILLPLFLISGPLLSDFSISFCSLLFLINSYINNDLIKKYYHNKFFLIFIIFWCLMIFSSILSDNIIYSLKTSLPYLRFGIFSLSVWYLLDNNPKFLKYFFYILVFSFIILILDGYLQFFNGKNILNYKVQGTRISSFFGDELILGSYLSRLYPLAFGLFIYYQSNKYKK